MAGAAGGAARRALRVSARPGLDRRFVAEAVGTAMLLAAVVGSGIMGERLAGGNVAVALLANTLATGAALVALILTFGPISGAHFNPAVTLARSASDTFAGIRPADAPAFIAAQLVGAGAATSLFRWLAPASAAHTEPTTLVHTVDIGAERSATQRGGHS